MTDDLVAMVRAAQHDGRGLCGGLCGELADRVEALTARAEAAEADAARFRAACAPLGSAMYFMDDSASDEDVCIISAKTIKDIRAALKGEQK